MFSDYLYNLRMRAQAITNENLRISHERWKLATGQFQTEIKNPQTVALGPRRYPKRVGGGGCLLPVHALQRVQNFQKKKYSVQPSNYRDKHSHRDGKLCAVNVPTVVATVCPIRDRSDEPLYRDSNNRYAILENQ